MKVTSEKQPFSEGAQYLYLCSSNGWRNYAAMYEA